MSGVGFQPSVEAAQKALPRADIVSSVHPGGSDGVKLSLQEVADRIKKGRNDPRVRAWAIRAVKAAGGPKDTRGQAVAVLAALKAATVYVQDPVNTEFIQAAHETLCLDDKGLCFRGGDCDDLVVAYGSATLSIGIPTKIVGECFHFEQTPSHVLAAIQDTKSNEWLRVDPSTEKPVGEYVTGTKEVWIDPMETSAIAGIAGSSPSGDFVGVGRIGVVGDANDSDPPVVTSTSTVLIALSAGIAIGAVAFLVYEKTVPRRTPAHRRRRR